jgi:uroporphyrin-III C-methyltransferase
MGGAVVSARLHPVWLVGAGPGDPELLTLKALRAIEQADVLLVDDLVDRRVLAHARPGARIVEVGKRGGCPSTPQAFIERLLVHEARAGRRVVRLKGGDPMIFGRAGEELDALRAAGLEAEVVPGISAALGAAASLGLSLTDRRHAPGVAFVTGHAQPGGEEPDWAALARSGLTLVVYMGIRRAAAVASALLAGGLAPDTPTVTVRRATLADEERHPGTLEALAQPRAQPQVQAQARAQAQAQAHTAEPARTPVAISSTAATAAVEATEAAAPGLLIIGDVVRGLQALVRDTAATSAPGPGRAEAARPEPACHAA